MNAQERKAMQLNNALKAAEQARTERDKLLALCDEAQEALDLLAGDIEDTYPARAEATADLAMRLRAALPAAPLGVLGTPTATATPNATRTL